MEEIQGRRVLDEILEVKAAVAYAKGVPEIFDYCIKNSIPLSFYCRYDNGIPVSTHILEKFIGKQSRRIKCKLAGDYFHAKVIWIVGHGVYIGSANLTNSAWFSNIEAGVFLYEYEIDLMHQRDHLENFFNFLENNSTDLSTEIINQLKDREKRFNNIQIRIDEFYALEENRRLIPKRPPKISTNKTSASDRNRVTFIDEWNATLEILREIGHVISDKYTPSWINDTVPNNAQVDQSLHAYYYTQVMKGNASSHRELHEKNKTNIKYALEKAMHWWSKTRSAPSEEDRQLYIWAPRIQELTRREKIQHLTIQEFSELCAKIHAFRNHSRQIRYTTLSLKPDEYVTNGEDKIQKGAEWVYNQHSSHGKSVLELIYFTLYSGDNDSMSTRLWEAHRSEHWKIPHFGLSCLGELIGWALPSKFPPRNGRTSKALYALGYDVTLYIE